MYQEALSEGNIRLGFTKSIESKQLIKLKASLGEKVWESLPTQNPELFEKII